MSILRIQANSNVELYKVGKPLNVPFQKSNGYFKEALVILCKDSIIKTSKNDSQGRQNGKK